MHTSTSNVWQVKRRQTLRRMEIQLKYCKCHLLQAASRCKWQSQCLTWMLSSRAEAGKWRRGRGGSCSSIFSYANTKATNRRTIEPTFRRTSQSSCCSPSFSVSPSLSLSLSLIVFLHCFCLWHTHNECNKRKREERQTSTVGRQRKIKTLLDMANNLIFQLMKIWKWKWKAQKGTQLQRQRLPWHVAASVRQLSWHNCSSCATY